MTRVRKVILCVFAGVVTSWLAVHVRQVCQGRHDNGGRNEIVDSVLPAPTIRFSSLEAIETTESHFDKPEMVYAFLEFPTSVTGTHVIDVSWKRPDGMTQEASSIPMHFPESGGRRADIWLRFHESRHGLDIFRGGPDESRRLFNGQWTLETRQNGRDLAKASFVISGY
ncbi:MAG: hypothetical protein LHV69_04385 [Elusimicrobia bacterium]|nr:hypothetical protein [Candidatus Obscuribacterium magneticum]